VGECSCVRSIADITPSLQDLLSTIFSLREYDTSRARQAANEASLAEIDAEVASCAAEVAEARRAGAQARHWCAQAQLRLKVAQSRKDRAHRAAKNVQAAHEEATALALSSGTAALPYYADKLIKLGVLLSALLPTRYCCNTPGCASWRTASEGFLLVRGKACVCAGCIAADTESTAEAPAYCFAARWVFALLGQAEC
jgi:hypothetical protein